MNDTTPTVDLTLQRFGSGYKTDLLGKASVLKKLNLPLSQKQIIHILQGIDENPSDKENVSYVYKKIRETDLSSNLIKCPNGEVYLGLGKKSLLEKGHLKRVFPAWNITKTRRDAIAKTNISKSKARKMCENEIKILTELKDCPQVVKLYHSFEYINNKSFLTNAMILSSPGDDLFKLIHKGPMTLKNKVKIACSCAEALKNLHEKRIVHGDLKPENILIDPKLKAYLIDFGSAKHFEEKGFLFSSSSYEPPCMLELKFHEREIIEILPSIDVWQLGCTFYYLFHQQPIPWRQSLEEEKDPHKAKKIINKFNKKYLGNQTSRIDREFHLRIARIIHGLLDPNADSRWSAARCYKKWAYIKKELKNADPRFGSSKINFGQPFPMKERRLCTIQEEAALEKFPSVIITPRTDEESEDFF